MKQLTVGVAVDVSQKFIKFQHLLLSYLLKLLPILAICSRFYPKLSGDPTHPAAGRVRVSSHHVADPRCICIDAARNVAKKYNLALNVEERGDAIDIAQAHSSTSLALAQSRS